MSVEFYEGEDGRALCRIVVPDGGFGSLQEAVTVGLDAARSRLASLEKVQRQAEAYARAPSRTFTPPEPMPTQPGNLDGIILTPLEIHAAVNVARATVDRFKQALDALKTQGAE